MPEEIEAEKPKSYKLKTTFEEMQIPGYRQALDIDVVVPRVELLLDRGLMVFDWEVSPASDDTIAEPKPIDSDSTILPQIPPYLAAALQRYFEEVSPAMMADWVKWKMPPEPTPEEPTPNVT